MSKNDLSKTKPRYSTLLGIAFPLILANISHTILTFSDRYFIAKLGMEEAASVSINATLIWFMFMLIGFVSGGTRAIVSRKKGEGNKKEMNLSIEQSILLGIIIGTIIFFIGIFFSRSLFNFFDVTDNVASFATSYFRIFLFGYPAIFVSIIISSIYQSVGKPKIPMVIFGVSSIVNLCLDPILIYGFGPIKAMGVEGAALATAIVEILSLVWLLFYFYKTFDVLPLYKLRINKEMMKRIFSIGKWTGLNSFSRPFSGIYFQKIVSHYGTNSIAAFGFGIQWLSLTFIFVDSIAISVMTLVGQYLGSNRIDYLKLTIKKAYVLFSVFVILNTGFLLIFSKEAISLFSNNPEIISIGSNYLKIVMSSLILIIPSAVSRSVFAGSGDTKPVMIISFLSNWPVKISFAYISAYILDLSVSYLWIAVALSVVFESLFLYIWYKRGKWLKKKV